MFDPAAALFQEFDEPIADSAAPEPRIKLRPASQLVATAPTKTNWLSPKNLILGGMGSISVGILAVAIASTQPKPAEQIVPFKPTTLNDVAPQILAENRERQVQSLADLNALAEEGLKQDDKAAVRILAAKYVIEANKAVQQKGGDCFSSPQGLDCYLNSQEEVWAGRRKQSSLAKDSDEMVRATNRLRAIEMARQGKVELVESDPELTELALRNRYNARVDMLNSSANEKARKLNQKL